MKNPKHWRPSISTSKLRKRYVNCVAEEEDKQANASFNLEIPNGFVVVVVS